MDAMKPIDFDKINDINISQEMKASFLSYAMSVIVSRALPDVRDGLKPVHRRILYGMDVLGVHPEKPYKKSARIVGDVMGKYHPHGDSAIYDAMVRMAQEFSYRCPLVNGHGNFGSIDGDGAAAMRYTEAKMTKIAKAMLEDIGKNTIDFVDNYDGTEKEPSVLPSKFPNLLVNGSTGIAVGMATNIPPHNLGEVIDGVLAMIDDEDISVDELMNIVKGPDFPTGGTIMGMSGLRQAYETGNGSIKVRARAEITEEKSGKKTITVTEIPYQVNKSRLIEKIAEIAKEKRIEGITDLRDESNRNGIKIVIELRKDTNAEVTLNNLYKFTPLQTSFGMNMLALVDNQPKVLGLKAIIKHYIDHQVEVLIRRSQYDLDRAKAREHILEGLLIALDNIDAVIDVIRKAYDDAEEQLMEKFNLSEAQAKAILEMRLRRLSGLEREKIQQERETILETIKHLEALLASESMQLETIKDDLNTLKDTYADARRTDISLALDLDIEDEDLIPEESIIVTVTRSGYCKRMSTETYKTQNRGGKGLSGIKTHEDDAVEHIIHTSTHDYLLFFTNLGRVYKMKAYKVPEFGRHAKGLPLVNLVTLEAEEHLQAITHITDFTSEANLLFVTRKGVIKRTRVSDFQNIRTTGIRAITLAEGDTLYDVRMTTGNQDIVIGATNGKAIRFNETDARPMGRVARGVRGIALEEDAVVVGMAIVDETAHQVLVVTENGYGKRSKIELYRTQKRGGKGVKTLNVTEKNGALIKLASVCGNEDLIIITNKGMMIRLPIEQISLSTRATQGVRLMRLNGEQKVVTVEVVPKEENGDDETMEMASVEDINENSDSLAEPHEAVKQDESTIDTLEATPEETIQHTDSPITPEEKTENTDSDEKRETSSIHDFEEESTATPIQEIDEEDVENPNSEASTQAESEKFLVKEDKTSSEPTKTNAESKTGETAKKEGFEPSDGQLNDTKPDAEGASEDQNEEEENDQKPVQPTLNLFDD